MQSKLNWCFFCCAALLTVCSYGVLVLLIEIISSTATFGYAVLLIKYSKSRRTKGLPIPKKGQQPDLDNLKFHVRVLIPCYKESVELVKLTTLGALKAPLPKDTLRTVYLCDDGKDPAKEEMVRELNNEWGCLEYVSGRKRDPNGEFSCMAAQVAYQSTGQMALQVEFLILQQQLLASHNDSIAMKLAPLIRCMTGVFAGLFCACILLPLRCFNLSVQPMQLLPAWHSC